MNSSYNYGKKFETKFRVDWNKTFPSSLIFRLPDQMSGFKNISKNPSDFICYTYPNIYFIECKTSKGASISFDNLTQYDKLLELSTIHGIRAGFLIWLYEKDVGVIYVPASTIKKMKANGEKSFGIRHLNNDKYFYLICPSTKLRTFYDTDYSVLSTLKDGQ